MMIPLKHYRRALGYLDLFPPPKFLLEPLYGTEQKHLGVTKGGMWGRGGVGWQSYSVGYLNPHSKRASGHRSASEFNEEGARLRGGA